MTSIFQDFKRKETKNKVMINLTKTFRSQAHLDSVVKEYYKKIGKWVEGKIDASLEINNDNELLKFLKRNLKTIIIGKPAELIEFYEEIKTKNFDDKIVIIRNNSNTEKRKRNKERKPTESVITFIQYAFDYKTFRDKDKGKWWAEQVNIKTCVYCNVQSTHILKRTDKVEIAYQFDHFYPKSEYPYFALSFYNLTPSCASCNNRKKDKTIALHPYVNDFDKLAVFSVDEDSIIDFILGKEKEIKYMKENELIAFFKQHEKIASCFFKKAKIEDTSKLTIEKKVKLFFKELHLKMTIWEENKQDVINMLKLLKDVKELDNILQINIKLRETAYNNEGEKLIAAYQLANYKDIFQLDAIYANHTDIVTELYQKKYHYPESRKKEISDLLAGTGERLTPEEITRMLRGSYIEREKILQRPLSKLIKDISDELDLI